jgi:hypothetical protein
MGNEERPAVADEPPDHSGDPRSTGTGSGGYPEENPVGDSEDHPARRRQGGGGGRRGVKGDPGQATGNPRAAGATGRRADSADSRPS